MRLVGRILRLLSGLVGIALLVLAALLRETLVSLVTTPLAALVMSAQATLGGEWIFRGVIALVGVLLLLVAIGLDKVEEAAKRIYAWYQNLRHPEKAQQLETQERRSTQDAPSGRRPDGRILVNPLRN